MSLVGVNVAGFEGTASGPVDPDPGGGGLTEGIYLELPATLFDVTGSPALDGDTLEGTLKVQVMRTFFAGPTAGADAVPAFRAIAKADLPAIAYADLPAIASQRLLGNMAGGSAVPGALSIDQVLDAIFGTTRSTLIFRGATVWQVLGPGSPGQYLKTGGGAFDPAWDNPPGVGVGGSSKVTKTAVALGTQAAGQTAFTYTTVASTAIRGLVSRLLITVDVAASFDVVVRGAGNDSGTLWLQAYSVGGLTYEVTFPFYFENDAAGSDFYVGIRNNGTVSVVYTLTALRVERFL